MFDSSGSSSSKTHPMYKLDTSEFDQERIQCYEKSYGVFCMAMSMKDRDERELDYLWGDAIKMYDSFLVSDFNDLNKSELDCIQDYIMDAEISK
jgi:hypothetical protein